MARKRLNKNLVVGITLVVFVIMIVLSALMLNQLQQRDPKYFVELAQAAAKNGDWQQAALFYNEAWERSSDPLHLVSLGDALLSNGDVERARAGKEERREGECDQHDEQRRRERPAARKVAREQGADHLPTG